MPPKKIVSKQPSFFSKAENQIFIPLVIIVPLLAILITWRSSMFTQNVTDSSNNLQSTPHNSKDSPGMDPTTTTTTSATGTAATETATITAPPEEASTMPTPRPTPTPRPDQKIAVPRLKWEPNKPFAKFAEAGNAPVIFTNTVVDWWPARHWSLSALKTNQYFANTNDKSNNNNNKMSGIYRHTTPVFGPFYDAKRPMHGMRYVSRSKKLYEPNVTMNIDDFWREIAQPVPGKFLYFTGDVPDAMIPEISPGLDEMLSLGPQKSAISLWAGQASVLSPCHYDGYRNFYTVLLGRKRFRIFPPTAADSLRPYPYLHPHHAQCQTNVSLAATDSSVVGSLGSIEMVAELSPGDMLYLPPMWFHEVETLEPSVAVNVWTDTSMSNVAEQLQTIPIPLDAAGSDTSVKVAVVSIFIWTLLDAVSQETGQNPAEFVSRLFKQRYDGLRLSRDALIASKDNRAFVCKRAIESEQTLKGMSLHKFTHEAKANNYAVKARELVRLWPESSRITWLMNHIESLALFAVGKVEDVPSFLLQFDHCHEVMTTDLVSKFKRSDVKLRKANV